MLLANPKLVPPSRTILLEKAVLKSILPLVASQENKSPLLMLGRISAVSFSHKTTKQRRPKCTVCGAVYENYLLFVLHLQLIHKGEIEVGKYEFSLDLLVIYYREPEKGGSQRNYIWIKGKNMFLLQSFQARAQDILDRIAAKFTKKAVKQRKEYFHSYDVFRQLGPESEDEDSEDDLAYIERELEKVRIADFTDITEQDKVFFMGWNKAIHQARREHAIINREELLEVLKSFAGTARHLGVKRLNLVMHVWTLWCAGAINADDVSNFLQTYDSYDDDQLIQ